MEMVDGFTGASCVFCYKETDINKSLEISGNDGELAKRFLHLAERHLTTNLIRKDDDNVGKDVRRVFRVLRTSMEEIGGGRLGSCEDCRKIQSEFCDLYHRAKRLEIEATWRLRKLTGVMKGAGSVSWRVESLRRNWRRTTEPSPGGAGSEFLEDFVSARNQLIQLCNSENYFTFPRLVLKKLSGIPGQICNDVDHTSTTLSEPQNLNLRNEVDSISGEEPQVEMKWEAMTAPPLEDENPNELEESGGTDGEVEIGSVEMSKTEFEHTEVEDESNLPPSPPEVDNVVEEDSVQTTPSKEDKAANKYGLRKRCKRPELQSLITPTVNPKRSRNEMKEEYTVSSAEEGSNIGDDNFSAPSDSESSTDDDLEDGSSGSDPEDFPITPRIKILTTELDESILKLKLDNDDLHDDAGMTLGDLLNHSGPLPKKYACQVESCHLKFTFQKELQIHSKLHGQFPCQFCSEELTYAPDLAIHESEKHWQAFDKSLEGESPRVLNRDQKQLLKSRNKSHKYKCARCPFSSKGKAPFVQHHVRRHLKLDWGRSSCPVCWKIFQADVWRRDWYTFQKHFRIYHQTAGMTPSEIHRCAQCPAFFRQKLQLQCHVNKDHRIIRKIKKQEPPLPTETDTTKYRCPVRGCNLNKFWTKEGFENHSKWHGKFPCTQCDTVMTYAPELALHEADHQIETKDGKRVFKCLRCDFKKVKRISFVLHYLQVHLQLPTTTHVCLVCQKEFWSFGKGWPEVQRNLVKHMTTYHDSGGMEESQILRCDDCPGATFKKAIHLEEHRKLVHGFVLSCSDCGKLFPGREGRKRLADHRLTTHKMNPKGFQFECRASSECRQRFETKAQLERHEIYNHREGKGNVLICSKCGKRCLGTQGLRSHELSHKDDHKTEEEKQKERLEKRVESVCEQCGKVFPSMSNLKTHELTHAGPEAWTWTCEICGKKFRVKSFLDVHMRIHTKEMPFPCRVCGRRFRHLHNMTRHEKLVHKRSGESEKNK